MTATEELRRMLDERGVKWFETAPLKTEWNGTGILSDIGFQAIGELPPAPQYLLLDADHLFTPEQAIAATLGAGTCEADETETIACRCYSDPHGKAVYHIHVMECTECGHTYEHVNGDYEYCPRCGRKRRDFVE